MDEEVCVHGGSICFGIVPAEGIISKRDIINVCETYFQSSLFRRYAPCHIIDISELFYFDKQRFNEYQRCLSFTFIVGVTIPQSIDYVRQKYDEILRVKKADKILCFLLIENSHLDEEKWTFTMIDVLQLRSDMDAYDFDISTENPKTIEDSFTVICLKTVDPYKNNVMNNRIVFYGLNDIFEREIAWKVVDGDLQYRKDQHYYKIVEIHNSHFAFNIIIDTTYPLEKTAGIVFFYDKNIPSSDLSIEFPNENIEYYDKFIKIIVPAINQMKSKFDIPYICISTELKFTEYLISQQPQYFNQNSVVTLNDLSVKNIQAIFYTFLKTVNNMVKESYHHKRKYKIKKKKKAKKHFKLFRKNQC